MHTEPIDALILCLFHRCTSIGSMHTEQYNTLSTKLPKYVFYIFSLGSLMSVYKLHNSNTTINMIIHGKIQRVKCITK